tara:strand:+ start:2707 stop:3765 length:1059 start_codon:yes stop_codon:yes gene_type:complete
MYGSGNSNNASGGSQYLGMPPTSKQQILKFYDSGASECQYYNYDDILGFEKNTSSKFTIYFKGARDVNAVDQVGITITGSTITVTEAIEVIINAPLYLDVHKSTTAVIEIVSDTAGNSIRPEFTAASIAYGACCTGSGGKDVTVKNEGSNLTTAVASIDFVGTGVNATTSSDNVTVTISNTNTQVLSSNYSRQTWSLAKPYFFPTNNGGNTGGTQTPSSISFLNFGALQASMFQRAIGTYTKATAYCAASSSQSASTIAGLTTGSGMVVKIVLMKATPSNGNTVFNFTETDMGTLTFNATANQLNITNQSVTGLSIGTNDIVGLALKATSSSGSPTGNLTGLALHATVNLFN